jgi:hypothetical protein
MTTTKKPAPDMSLDVAKTTVEQTATAPRVTEKSIEDKIDTVEYIEHGTMTICVITMINGFHAVGKSAPVNPANYHRDVGKRYAYEDAFKSLWQLEGYLLSEQKLWAEKVTADAAVEAAEFSDESVLHLAARVAHEVNRAYCQSIGDMSQLSWWEAPQWQKDSAIAGVQFVVDNPDATPADQHQSWLDHKYATGWKWGETKSEEFMTHPAMVHYDDLPETQKAKDKLFLAAVRAVIGIE